ncbi:hypothetical protein OQA88_4846 [Cercophora sp. LCS_1]
MTAAAVNGAGKRQAVLTSASRLRKIDILREMNIGQYMELPQLVAVGDQSSGKSSLLENLTGIPFPHGQELCTRYATQITHRRDDDEGIEISITPGDHASPEHKSHVESFRYHLGSTEQLCVEFPSILDKVNDHMNIKTPTNPKGMHTFSEDILKIEKRGPDEEYLTVIDVPGIFRVTSDTVTAEDRELVSRMVEEYIQNSRTIILAVLPANVDASTQAVIQLSKDHDKAGERTLGVLTKPDTLKERTQKTAVCNLVLGKRLPLKLGYYVVRNRGGDDDDADVDVAQRESVFRQEPWSTLPPDRVGIVALRKRLQEVLGRITDREFPMLLTETRVLLKNAQRDLDSLGPSRAEEREQQAYLMSIASKFQELVRDALSATYSNHHAFEAVRSLRLITDVVNLTDKFKTDFELFAHSYDFRPALLKEEQSEQLERSPGAHRSNDPQEGLSEHSHEATDRENGLDSGDFPELDDIVVPSTPMTVPADGILDWITEIHHGSRGVELGGFGPTILASAFRGQSVKWDSITRQFISKVITAVHTFFLQALELSCPDPLVCNQIKAEILQGLIDRYEKGMQQACFLVGIERGKRPYTVSEVFHDNLQASRRTRLAALLADKARRVSFSNGAGASPIVKQVVDIADIKTTLVKGTNDDYDNETIHDILEAYYTVARKRFVDNVWHQAVDHLLLTSQDSPLALFSESWVVSLDAETLKAVAGESSGVTGRRAALEKRKNDLKEAIKVLSR